MDVHELISAVKTTSESFAESLSPEGDWSPMLFIGGREEMSIAVIDPELLIYKEQFWGSILPNLITETMGGDTPEAVVMLASSWVVEYDPNAPGGLEETFEVPPSEHSRRTECLVLVGISSQAEVGAMAKIVRDDSHPPRLEWNPDAEQAGVMFAGSAIAGLRQAVWG